MEQNYQTIKPKHSGTKKFDNPFIEKITRTHISVPITLLLSIAAGLLYVAFAYTKDLSPGFIPVLFFSGLLFFTLLEYLAHRFLFHMKQDKEWKVKFTYVVHGIHHEYPKDKDRLAMPVPASLSLAGVFFIIFYSLMDTAVFGFLPGVLFGYCTYLFVHYIVHAYAPPKNFFKQLWVNHAVHHYKNSNSTFGVSSPLWDYVFGTYQKDSKK